MATPGPGSAWVDNQVWQKAAAQMDQQFLQSITASTNAASSYDPCTAQGHVVNLADNEQPVEYLDGQIVGYCARCVCRIVFPKVEGGLVAAYVRVLAAEILAGEFDEDTMAEYLGAVERLRQDKEVVEDALNTADLVRQVLAFRMKDE